MAHQIHLYDHFLFFLVALAVLQGIVGLEFDVYNNAAWAPGGARFDKEIGIPYTKQVMGDATKFIWNTFEQYHPEDRRPDVEVVHLLINQYTGPAAIAYGGACTVNLSAVYLEEYNYPGYDLRYLRWSFTSVMYHEMTHIWQWYPPGTPPGLIEGIADYTSMQANHYPPELAKPGSGERWDQGYGPTARFLEYCYRLRPGFVAALNRKMRYEWSVDYFVELLGKPVDQLWSDYKAEYEGSVSNVTVNANSSLWGEYNDADYEIKTRTETGTGCQLN